MLISLSLRTTISRLPKWPALFIASKAMPADIAPSPITATTSPMPSGVRPPRSRATTWPSAALIEVEEWAAPKGS